MLEINHSYLRSVLLMIVLIFSLFGPQGQAIAKTTKAGNLAAGANSTAGNVLLSGVPYNVGNIFITVGASNQWPIKHFSPDGTLLDQLGGGPGIILGGMDFDWAGNLYVTNHLSDAVSKFDNQGNQLLFFDTGDRNPTSIAINAAGHLYVGHAGYAGGTRDVLKFDGNGTLLASFNPALENRGVEHIDLATDQCTLLYTSLGKLIKRFNVCTNTQLSDFATLPISGIPPDEYALHLRIRQNGEVLVLTHEQVFRLDSFGNIIQTYPMPAGATFLSGLDLDPDLTSFWIGGYGTGEFSESVYKIDIASGTLLHSFNVGQNYGGDLAIFGGTVQPKLTIDPATATKTVGETVQLAGFLTNCLDSNVFVTFTVTGSNPQTGTGLATCDQIITSFSYIGNNPGTDTVVATAHTSQPPANLTSNTSMITWITPQDQADLSITKSDSPDPVIAGSNLTYTLTVTNNGPGDATGVTVTDTLPTGVTFVPATSSPSCTEIGGIVTCGVGDLGNGASATVAIDVTVDSGIACGSSLANTAVAASSESDSDASNNTANVDTIVSCPLTGIDPATVTATLASGDSLTVTKTVHTPSISPRPDLMFLADTTASMDAAIANLKTNAADIMNMVRTNQADSQFGAANYRDFNCSGDVPYTLNQAITADIPTAQAGINSWSAGGGCDTPEAQLNALFQLATDVATGWRPDSTRIVAWFGDASGHDPSNGHSLTDTITALNAAKIRVIAVPILAAGDGLDSTGQATAITNATGGVLMPPAISSQVADAIVAGLQNLPVTVTPTLGTCDPNLTVTWIPTSQTVTSGSDVIFDEMITVSAGAIPGTTLDCTVNFLIDGKIVEGFAQTIHITVPDVMPQTCPILDDFNRTNGPLGINWDGRTSGYRIINNQVAVRTGGPIYWQPEAYGSDQEACVTLTRINPKSKQHGLLLKVQELNDWRQGAILVSYSARTGNVEVHARDVSNHKWIQVGVLTPPTPVVDGDQLRAKAFADGTVEVLINDTSIGTADAGSFYVDKGGQIGLWFRGMGGEDDDDDRDDHDRLLLAREKDDDDDDDDDGSSALRALLDDFGGGTLLAP